MAQCRSADTASRVRCSVSTQALVLILSAAVLHAGWNILVKSSEDRLVATWAVAVGGAILNLPVLAVLGLPEARLAGWLLLSSVLHVGYGYALAGAYDRVDFSAAYPIARGSAPLIVTVAGVVFLDDVVSVVGVAGVTLVTTSLAIIGLRHVPTGVGWAVLTGLMIASYTLSDGAGVRAGDESIRYIGMLFVCHALLFTVVLVATRRSTASLTLAIRSEPGRLLLGGGASAGAYLLVMIAARTTPLGLVSGLRETSTGFGVVAGYFLLGERITRHHAIAVVVAIAGSILIAVS